MPRLAANLSWLYGELPFPERFAAAARDGFAAVEFLFPYDHPAKDIARWAEDAGVEIAMFNLPPGDWAAGERGLAGLPGREEAFSRSVEHALAYADALGVHKLHAMAGLLAPGVERACAWTVYLANLRAAAAMLAASGRTLLIEPINRRDMPGYLLQTLEAALAAVEAVGSANLRVQADLYHLQIEGGDMTRRLESAMRSVGHVQVAAVPDRGEPDAGELNHPHLFALLDALGYDGWVGCEYRPRGPTSEGLGWAAPLLNRGRRRSE